MSSSNKNWPSMFKSKPCNKHHHRDMETPSSMPYSNCNTPSPFSSDRVPDPKPRWNPKPEQIRILESIFNSGIVNPPREEIQRIRTRLQEYGQIGDANVFYWFQNRKSRAKHKLRVLKKNPKMLGCNPSKTRKEKIITPNDNPTDPCFGLVNHETGLFPGQNNELVITEPASFLYPDDNNPSLTQSGFGFGGFVVPVVAEERLELAGTSNGLNMNIPEIDFGGGENGYFPNSVPVTVPLTINQSQDSWGLFVHGEIIVSSGGGDIGDYVSPVRLTVFINDMPFDVAAGLFNVKEAFGNNAMLINSFGQPILTDEFGVTFQPLQNGAVYYLVSF
ncbi:hypothetical protein HID58_006803 [Brassica napus]|uniref:Homeobox domain-containing protein n=2 Tax=Brassica TaxID=3705 RepID=A0ABQ8ECE7_BRANA|nr:hypothetical protein HID58_006803 [Brassica napus]